MKKHTISTIFILILLALLISCSTTPEFSAYQSKPVRETAVISGQLLVETEWIPASGRNPKLRLIDFGRNGADYQAGHIPGAAFMDRKAVWNKVNGIPGMLPSVETMVAELEKAGVSNDSTVVIYDSNSGLWASRLFWALEYLGHADIHILNGGWAKWIRENRAVQTASYLPPRGKFIPHILPVCFLAFNKFLEFPETFLDVCRFDSRIGQSDIAVVFAFQGAAEVQAGAERNAGFLQHGFAKIIVVG